MKSKLLKLIGISATLAIVTSLCVISPVSAAGKGGGPENAADISGFQEYTLTHTATRYIVSAGTTIWQGPPRWFNGTLYDGTIKIMTDRIWYFPECDGSFGEGEAYWYFETRHNYATGTVQNHGILVWSFNNEYQGTLTITRNVTQGLTGNSIGTVPSGHLNVVDGTGDFRNFHGQINVWENDIPSGTLIMVGKFS